jgi:hypothetical protein
MECEDAGSLNEYIGCKIDQDIEGQSVKLTQSVLSSRASKTSFSYQVGTSQFLLQLVRS